MKVLTFNAGLLDLQILGRSLLKPTDWIAERFEHLHGSILALEPDIVVLQEIYTSRHKMLLADQLSQTFPHTTISSQYGPSLIPASLMTLSKWPMQGMGFHRFRDMAITEKLVDNKGFLLSSVLTPKGNLIVVNVHTTAGGTTHPEHPKIDRIRERQIDQLLMATQFPGPVLLAGDFNCGSVSIGNYQTFLDAGYVDAWMFRRPSDNGWTWEPTSILNVGGAHADWGCPAQRIDLVLLNACATQMWTVAQIERVFTEQTVPIDASLSATLSDHYGVLVTLTPAVRLPQ